MAIVMKPGWSKPSTILFATTIPADEKAFAFALAQAVEFNATLILFHVYDTMVVAASNVSGVSYYDFAATARIEKEQLEPLAKRVREAGVPCEVVVHSGLPADRILAYAQENPVERIVMGTHSPGPVGKLLVGSVAEAVLRSACIPVFIVGPDVVDGNYRSYKTKTILCAVSLQETSSAVIEFAAHLALEHKARLILEHIVKQQERSHVFAHCTVEQLEQELLNLIPTTLRKKLNAQALVVPGDPTEELLYQARAQQADLLVLGAQGASAFAAITRHGVVYKVLAHSHCPVITLAPNLLASCGMKKPKLSVQYEHETYIAGVV